MLLMNLLSFLGLSIVLVFSTEILVKSLVKVAFYLRLSEFVVGFMIVALATSIPELFIGITSALGGNPELSVGNVIGANIIDLTLVIGIVAVLRRGITVERKAVRINALYMFVITLLPLILMLDGKISKFDGLILLVAFFLYVLRLFKEERRFRGTIDVPGRDFIKNSAYACISIILLLVSADCIVKVASSMAIELAIPQIMIGLFLISFGTTLPELMFEAKAVLMRHQYMALGDLLGSVVANTTLVLGILALISSRPIEPDFLIFLTSCVFMIVVSFLFTTFVDVERHIVWREGMALILLYVLFVIVEFSMIMQEVT